MSLEQTAKQMRRQYMKPSDKYCDKHQRHYVMIQFPNSKPYTVCELCHREEQDQQNAIKAQEQYEREQEQKRLYFLKDFSLLDDDLASATFQNFKALTREQKEDLKAADSSAYQRRSPHCMLSHSMMTVMLTWQWKSCRKFSVSLSFVAVAFWKRI